MKKEKNVFPFVAIKGQDEMKLGLILNVIDPLIGGLLVFGDRGTGKSTTIRALVDLLPEIEVIKDNPYNQHPSDFYDETEKSKIEFVKTPMVNFPLGATEDRVCGSINIEKALYDGKRAFEPGLLAKANRGILYIDEVNLLDDHLIDIMLDASAYGYNMVEREGVSVTHPSRFVLVGSGNPEEGEVRPQLLDRFGLYSEIKTVKDLAIRIELVNSRMEFDLNPEKWRQKYEEEQTNLKTKIINAKSILPEVTINDDLKFRIGNLCNSLNIDGLRGDIVLHRAAKAYAAFQGTTTVVFEDIKKVSALALRHRLRKDPLQLIDSGLNIEKTFEKVFSNYIIN